jgi:hypothetical protein
MPDQPKPPSDEFDPLEVYGPPDPDDERELIYREVFAEIPHMMMRPTPPEGVKGIDPVAWLQRFIADKKKTIDAEKARRANDKRANEDYGILYRLGAFMGGPHAPPVPYDPASSESMSYWDARIEEERAKMGLPGRGPSVEAKDGAIDPMSWGTVKIHGPK